ncbi:MAG: homoserine kinase [Myxococcales bacterium]|nr:homoserine kinase [Myxococcales bacterium]
MRGRARAFGPATVANLAAGFDVLGLAVEGLGDEVEAVRVPEGGVRIAAITGDGGKLPLDAPSNTAGVAAAEVLRAAGAGFGVELSIHKGLPLGSGLGSSAASAVAAAVATQALLDEPLPVDVLVAACVEAEAVVSGRHADNVAPALLGGLVLVRSVEPLDLVRLPIPDGLQVVVVTPEMSLPTREARAVLPSTVPLPTLVAATANLGALVAACHQGDWGLLGRSLVDPVAGPAREPLIPGSSSAIAAARGAGALGAGISGAGPTLFALCGTGSSRAVADAMVDAFASAGLIAKASVAPALGRGARVLA